MASHRFAPAPAHDLPLLVGPDQAATLKLVKSYHSRGPGKFGYTPARTLLQQALMHSMSLGWLETQMLMSRPPLGRQPNLEVIRALWRIGGREMLAVHPAPRWALPIRRDMAVPISADALVVRSGKPFLFWMQLRTSEMVPTMEDLGLLARIFLIEAQRMDAGDLGLLIADLGTRTGTDRSDHVLTLDDLPIPTEAEATRKVQMVVDAYDELVSSGYDPAVERVARRKRYMEEKRRREGPKDLFPDAPAP